MRGRLRSALSGFLSGALLCAAGLCAACGEPAQNAGLEPGVGRGWNLLLITLDTTRPDFVSPFGGDPEITPNLSKLAERSWVFENAFSETNVTSPSHLTLFSGQRALEHGVLVNTRPVPASVETLPEAFRRAGYRTGGFPAVPHLGEAMQWQGFDVFVEPPPPVVDAPDVSGMAQRFLREEAGGPFFAWVHFFDPHALYEPPPEIGARFYSGDPTAGDGPRIQDAPYFEDLGEQAGTAARWLGEIRDLEYPRAMYAAELNYTDREVGRLLGLLEELGVAEKTVILVVADHGESLDEHGIYYDHKGLYEPQLRIPLMVHVPGAEPGRSDAFVSTLDVVPTLDELFGLDFERARTSSFAGRSLVSLMRGAEAPPVPKFFVHQNAHNHVVAVREGYWKLLVPVNPKHPVLARGVELFDLENDPGELVNLADAEPERVRAMTARARPWLEMDAKSGDTSHLSEEARQRLRDLGYE